MVKRGLEKKIEIPPCATLFFFLNKKAQNCKFSDKNDLVCAWRDFKKILCGVYAICIPFMKL